MTDTPHPGSPNRRIRTTGLLCLGLAVGMLGIAFAAVPLYSLFCKVTGYDGTPVVGRAASGTTLDRTVAVRFDANMAPGLNWTFTPESPEVLARLGETQTVFYKVRNAGPTATTGIAAFNVQPGQAGAFFVKLQCFCFQEQTLQAGETVELPVVFYVDPALAQNRDLADLSTITLSYTYFASKNGQPAGVPGG